MSTYAKILAYLDTLQDAEYYRIHNAYCDARGWEMNKVYPMSDYHKFIAALRQKSFAGLVRKGSSYFSRADDWFFLSFCGRNSPNRYLSLVSVKNGKHVAYRDDVSADDIASSLEKNGWLIGDLGDDTIARILHEDGADK